VIRAALLARLAALESQHNAVDYRHLIEQIVALDDGATFSTDAHYRDQRYQDERQTWNAARMADMLCRFAPIADTLDDKARRFTDAAIEILVLVSGDR
jgi:hypothetical protein